MVCAFPPRVHVHDTCVTAIYLRIAFISLFWACSGLLRKSCHSNSSCTPIFQTRQVLCIQKKNTTTMLQIQPTKYIAVESKCQKLGIIHIDGFPRLDNIRTIQNIKQTKACPKRGQGGDTAHAQWALDKFEIRTPSFLTPLSLLHARTRERPDPLRLADEVNRDHSPRNIRGAQARVGRLPLRDSGHQHQRRYALPTRPQMSANAYILQA